MVASTVALTAFRWWLAQKATSPWNYQDEGGYIAVARALAGDAPELYGPSYGVGWGVVLAPAAAVLEPSPLYRTGQLANVVFAGAALPVAHLIGRRVVGLAPLASAIAAIVATTTAASLVHATMLLPETLLVLVVLASVVAAHQALRTRAPAWGFVFGVVANLADAVHPRGIVVPGAAVAIVVIGEVLVRDQVRTDADRAERRRFIAAFLVGLAIVGIHRVVQVVVDDALFPAGIRPSLAGSPLTSITEPVGLVRITGGQLWYLATTSMGMVFVGIWVTAQRSLGILRGRAPEDAGLAGSAVDDTDDGAEVRARMLTGAFVLGGFLGSLAIGAAASYTVGTGDVNRADQVVYGRYIEHWLPALVLFAVALRPRVRAWWPVPAVFATAFAIEVSVRSFDPDVFDGAYAWSNIPALWILVDGLGTDFVRDLDGGPMLVVLVPVLVMGVARIRPAAAWGLALVPMLALQVASGATLVDDRIAAFGEAWAARHRLGPILEETGLAVAVEADATERADALEVLWAYNVQFWHPGVDIEIFRTGETPQAPLRIDGTATPPTPGAVLVGTERDGDLGLWAIDPAAVALLDAAGGAPGRPGATEPGR